MQVSLSIIRYPKRFVFFAFMAMAVHRLPLAMNKRVRFYKLLGCGKNGSFDKIPDLQQWGILTVKSGENDKMFFNDAIDCNPGILKKLYGAFISKWFQKFKCEIWTVFLEPLEGHGTWDGKNVFGELPNNSVHDGKIAVLTRATIRLSKLKYFWQHVAPVTTRMNGAKGFISSVGIGEVPWVKQATFSIWESKPDMKAFAYGMQEHVEVIKETRKQGWYREEMFVRFKITGSCGTLNGINPLKGK